MIWQFTSLLSPGWCFLPVPVSLLRLFSRVWLSLPPISESSLLIIKLTQDQSGSLLHLTPAAYKPWCFTPLFVRSSVYPHSYQSSPVPPFVCRALEVLFVFLRTRLEHLRFLFVCPLHLQFLIIPVHFVLRV